MVAPIIPALNDSEIESLLEGAHDAGATGASYVLLRLPHELREIFPAWLREHVPERAEHILSLLRQMHGGDLYDARFGVRGRGQGPLADMLAAPIQAGAEKIRPRPQGKALPTAHRPLLRARRPRQPTQFALRTIPLRKMPFSKFSLSALVLCAVAFQNLAGASPALPFSVEETLPHDSRIFTQGLEFRNPWLFESSGDLNQSSLSMLRITDLKPQRQVDLPAGIFAEGITLVGDQLLLLSWRGERLLRFSLAESQASARADIQRRGLGPRL